MRYMLVILAFCSHTMRAQVSGESRLVLKSVQERYKTLGSWRAKFIQHTHSKGLGKGQNNHGIFHFFAPDRFVYSLKGPEFHDFISNGKQAWSIRYPNGPKEAAVVKEFRSVRSLDLSKYLFVLRGLGNQSLESINRSFLVEGEKTGDSLRLSLEPRRESDVAKVELFFDNHVEAPTRAVITDQLGTSTQISIASFEKITSFDPSLFEIRYPKGSRVEKL